MSISNTASYSGPYDTNGVTTSFPFTFISMSATEVEVILRDSNGVDSVVTPSSYSVSRNADGTGTVVFDTAPASGAKIFVNSDVDFTQEISFADGSGWKASPHNTANDRSAARDIVIKDLARRSIKGPIGDGNFELPASENRVGKFISFGPMGDLIMSSGTGSDPGLRADIAAADGPKIIGFQGDDAGSVVQTAFQKFSQFIYVNEFGLVGDGMADDTAKLSYYFAAAATKGVPISLLGGGIYKITSTIQIPANVCLDMRGATILLDFDGGAGDAIILGANAEIKNGKIVVPTGRTMRRVLNVGEGACGSRIVVMSVEQQQNSVANLDAAVRIGSADNAVLEDIFVQNFDHSYLIYDTNGSCGRNLRAESYTRAMLVRDSDSVTVSGYKTKTASPNASTDPGHNGLLITSVTNSDFDNIKIVNAGEHGIRIGGATTGPTRHVSFSGIHVEKPGRCGFKFLDDIMRVEDISITGLVIVDCSYGSSPGVNEDGLRIQNATSVRVDGLHIRSRDNAVSCHDGIHIGNSTDIVINAPYINDVARDSIHITDVYEAGGTGAVNGIHIKAPTVVVAGANLVNVSTPTETARDICITDIYGRSYAGFGIVGTFGAIAQPIVFTGVINREGSGIYSSNSVDARIHVNLEQANNSTANCLLTISAGAITLPTMKHAALYFVDTEASSASDDLVTITGTRKDHIITLAAASSSRTVVLKDGTGNLVLAGDFSLTHNEDSITLIFNGVSWVELSRSDNNV